MLSQVSLTKDLNEWAADFIDFLITEYSHNVKWTIKNHVWSCLPGDELPDIGAARIARIMVFTLRLTAILRQFSSLKNYGREFDGP